MSQSSESSNGPGRHVRRIPEGDDRERLVCLDCGLIQYENPKVVVGSVVTYGDRLLLCRRAIEPRLGFWTMPAGYMELEETTAEGAMREAWEEARARITIDALLAVYNIPRISQVQVIYRAFLEKPEFKPGPESQDVVLFDWEDIPWQDLAFPSVHWSLNQYHATKEEKVFQPGTNPAGDLGNS